MSDNTETNPEAQEAEEVSDLTTDNPEGDEDADDALTEGEEGDDDADELEEVEWEGKTHRLPPEVKAALMRTADYTRKTQDISDARKALDSERTAFAKQAETSQEITEGRVQFEMLGRQIKALDELDWDKMEEEDAAAAQRAFRQRQLLRDRQIDLAGEITQKQKTLDLDRQREADTARAKAIQETQTVLKRDIKGWNDDLAVKVGEYAVTKLGLTPQEVLGLTDPRIIKAIHAAFVGDHALRKIRQQQKLEAGDTTTPVRAPGGGGAAPNARRTTDASGDGLSTAEWIKREQAREAAARAKR